MSESMTLVVKVFREGPRLAFSQYSQLTVTHCDELENEPKSR